MALGGGRRKAGGVGDQACSPTAFPLFLAQPMPPYSPAGGIVLCTAWGPGPSSGGGSRPVQPLETAVVLAAGEAQAESGGLRGGGRRARSPRVSGRDGGPQQKA